MTTYSITSVVRATNDLHSLALEHLKQRLVTSESEKQTLYNRVQELSTQLRLQSEKYVKLEEEIEERLAKWENKDGEWRRKEEEEKKRASVQLDFESVTQKSEETSSENAALRKRISSLSDSLSQARAQLLSLDRVATESSMIDTYGSLLNEFLKLRSKTALVQESNANIFQLKETNRHLMKRLANYDNLNKQVVKLRVRNDMLEKLVAAGGRAGGPHPDMPQRPRAEEALSKVMAEKTQSEHALQGERQKVQQMQMKIEVLERHNARLTAILDAMEVQGEEDDANSDIAQVLREQLDDQKTIIRKLEEKLEKQQSLAAPVTGSSFRRRSEGEQELEQLRLQNSRQEERIKTLEQQVSIYAEASSRFMNTKTSDASTQTSPPNREHPRKRRRLDSSSMSYDAGNLDEEGLDESVRILREGYRHHKADCELAAKNAELQASAAREEAHQARCRVQELQGLLQVKEAELAASKDKRATLKQRTRNVLSEYETYRWTVEDLTGWRFHRQAPEGVAADGEPAGWLLEHRTSGDEDGPADVSISFHGDEMEPLFGRDQSYLCDLWDECKGFHPYYLSRILMRLYTGEGLVAGSSSSETGESEEDFMGPSGDQQQSPARLSGGGEQPATVAGGVEDTDGGELEFDTGEEDSAESLHFEAHLAGVGQLSEEVGEEPVLATAISVPGGLAHEPTIRPPVFPDTPMHDGHGHPPPPSYSALDHDPSPLYVQEPTIPVLAPAQSGRMRPLSADPATVSMAIAYSQISMDAGVSPLPSDCGGSRGDGGQVVLPEAPALGELGESSDEEEEEEEGGGDEEEEEDDGYREGDLGDGRDEEDSEGEDNVIEISDD